MFQVSFEVVVVSAKARGLPEGRPEVSDIADFVFLLTGKESGGFSLMVPSADDMMRMMTTTTMMMMMMMMMMTMTMTMMMTMTTTTMTTTMAMTMTTTTMAMTMTMMMRQENFKFRSGDDRRNKNRRH